MPPTETDQMTSKPENAKPRVPPPRHKRGLQVEPPKPNEVPVPQNMAVPNSGFQDLNFKVSPELHSAFKITAAMCKIPMKDLLEAAFRCWQEHYGTEHTRSLLPPKLNK